MENRFDHPTLLGTVQDVNGASIGVVLSDQHPSGLVFVNGQGYHIGQVGSFVKVAVGYVDLFGIVSQAGVSALPETALEQQLSNGHRWLRVQLIGEAYKKGRFQRGVSQYPTIDDEVHLVSEDDLDRIYGEGPGQDHWVSIGYVAGARSIDARIDVNKLVTRHSAVVGTTGSGKSTTVAGILNALTDADKFPSARVLVLDIHGEYANAFKDRAEVYRVDAKAEGEKSLYIPYWAIPFDELAALSLGEMNDPTRGFVQERIVELKKQFRENNSQSYGGKVTEEDITVDSPVPFSISRLWWYLHRIAYSTHDKPATGQKFGKITEEINISDKGSYKSNSTEAFQKDSKGNFDIGNPEKLIPPKYEAQKQGKIYLQTAIDISIRKQVDNLLSKLLDPRLKFLFHPGDWKPDAKGKRHYPTKCVRRKVGTRNL